MDFSVVYHHYQCPGESHDLNEILEGGKGGEVSCRIIISLSFSVIGQ